MPPNGRAASATPSSVTRPRRRAAQTRGSNMKIILNPVNADFEPIVLTGTDEGSRQVVAVAIEMLDGAFVSLLKSHTS